MNRCTICDRKIHFFSQKYWDFDLDGTGNVLCKSCGQELRAGLDKHRLASGYTRFVLRIFGELPVELPTVCMACAASRGEGGKFKKSKEAISISNGFVTRTLTTPHCLCSRCAGLKVDARQFIRFRFVDTDLIIDVGNQEVADVFRAQLQDYTDRLIRTFQNQEIPLRDPTTRSTFPFLVTGEMIREYGLRATTAVHPGDKEWLEP